MSMSGINLHMTQNSFAGAWKPRNDTDGVQTVRSTYYAYAAMAQLIGSGNGTTQIASVSSDSMPAAYDDYVRYVFSPVHSQTSFMTCPVESFWSDERLLT